MKEPLFYIPRSQRNAIVAMALIIVVMLIVRWTMIRRAVHPVVVLESHVQAEIDSFIKVSEPLPKSTVKKKRKTILQPPTSTDLRRSPFEEEVPRK